MKARRGFLIIAALFVLTVLLVLGMGLMSTQSARYRGTARLIEATQAHELALSGMEDARSKLALNPNFPPNPAEDQPVFNYAEDVVDSITGKTIGSYEVTIDTASNHPPYLIIRVTSTGTVGPRESPLAQRILRGELQRQYGTTPATTLFRWVNLQDMGGL